ncbi:potassium channel family protein [Shewanella profunda]|uniref:potassium channel family protein n=1 Tax=Shewanella profunda TaxID=254793 RepID=UPI00200FAC3C|nr:potassium channel family protein [Shewanella profunda]MCL1090332.1 potassium channel family protein [Shewanella profunda]
MKLGSISVRVLFFSYLACILVFAVIYYYAPNGLLNKDLTPVSALYFSIVTITTLGYGDILPISWYAQIAISLQALLGITILGLLINAVWTGHANKIEDETKKSIEHQAIITNDRKLKSYSTALSWVFNNMRHSFFEVTTPVTKREGNSLELNKNFKEKDLSGMFDLSLKYKNGSNTSIESFYANEDTFVNELKFILANFELDHHPELQQSIIDYIGHHYSDQARGSLLLFAKDGHEGVGAMMIKAALKNHEDGEHFNKGVQRTELTPVLIFSINLRMKYDLMASIDNALRQIYV